MIHAILRFCSLSNDRSLHYKDDARPNVLLKVGHALSLMLAVTRGSRITRQVLQKSPFLTNQDHGTANYYERFVF